MSAWRIPLSSSATRIRLAATARLHPRRVPRGTFRNDRDRTCPLQGGEPEREDRAVAVPRAGRLQRTAVLLDDRPADRQPEAEALNLPPQRLLRAVEGGEDRLRLAGAEADPLVAHGDRRAAPVGCQCDRDQAA